MSAQFKIRTADPNVVAKLEQELGVSAIVASVLAARGITSVAEANDYLTPSLDRDWHNPYDIPGMKDVVDVLEEQVRGNKRILVFGDFDLDGISATTVLTRGLRELGADAVPFIPRRFEEGYSLTQAALERAKTYEPDFIVTVDCGIASKHEAARVVEAGIGLAITDHHEPADLVPQGVPVADPKISDCESDVLAGVGVALKVVQALGARLGQPYLWRDFTDFATLGTVADLMPMRGENRALVSDGIARMNANPRPCIAALLGTTGVAGKRLAATNLSFSLIPRLNAAGRMGDAMAALDLLMCDDFDEACRLAEALEEINDHRRSIEAELSEIAKDQAADVYRGQRALVVAGEGWHEGVKGIVASRLVGIYGVPTLLFTIEGDEARGSGRSVGQVNLFKAVESCADILTRFGGHEAAVGVTLPADKLPEFSQRLCAYMEALDKDSFHPLVEIDACVDLSELTLENVEQLEALAPFGQENKVPKFLARCVTLTNCRAVGSEKNHFSCMLTDGKSQVAGIMFHCPDIELLLQNDGVVNAAFEVQIDEWRGTRKVKAMLNTLAPTRACCALEACLDSETRGFVTSLYETDDAELIAERKEDPEVVNTYEQARAENRAAWERRAQENPQGLQEEIVRALIGERSLHDSQRAVLNHLAAGNSILAVMATGRGKSLTFHVHAAVRALAAHEASLFVYPLRALIADQAFHLTEALESFGINSEVLTGESSPEERARIFAGLVAGTVDIVLTTPEFLEYHAQEFAQARRIGFVVIDEAHHVGLARAGQRLAYSSIGRAIRTLGDPVVLALTATASDDVTESIDEQLSTQGHVVDETARDNLYVNDQRNIRDRDTYLSHLIAQGDKTVIYVNSREHSVAVARTLRRKVPHMAPLIGFYNAGLTRAERKRIEQLFRNDVLSVLVATSAFGEGVDIPNVRNVVLYHMPFNEIEFNQMAGRAGRDGKPSVVHLLYGRNDVSINEGILRDMTPDHDVMAQVYRRLRSMQRACPGDYFETSAGDLSAVASDVRCTVSPAAAACGLAVFRELGLIEVRTTYAQGAYTHMVRVREDADRVELTDSVRYREGLDEYDIFNAFRSWAMGCDAEGVIRRVSHPIFPTRARRDFWG